MRTAARAATSAVRCRSRGWRRGSRLATDFITPFSRARVTGHPQSDVTLAKVAVTRDKAINFLHAALRNVIQHERFSDPLDRCVLPQPAVAGLIFLQSEHRDGDPAANRLVGF